MFAIFPFLDAGVSTSLHMCPATNSCPGVYDNVLTHADSPVYNSDPHVWKTPTTVDPTSFDAPYNSYAIDPSSASTSKLGFIGGAGIEGGQGNSDYIYGSHDDHSTYGVLGGGWQGPGNGEAPGNLWNPALGTHSSGMAPAQQLAAPLATSASGAAGSEAATGKTVRASPAHGMLVGHAMLFGAVTASKEVVESGFSVSWNDRFRSNSKEACEAVTPVGSYLLKTHILAE